MTSQLVWLITGTSQVSTASLEASGFGRELVLEVLKRGDKVIATTRGSSVHKLGDLKAAGAYTLELDVTAPLDDLRDTAKKAVEVYGRVDVLVNNAGYGMHGALEEITPEKTLEQFNGNLFGPLNVTRAILPYMRAAKSGTILWNGSMSAWIPFVGAGLYAATKAAMHSISSTLNAEISPLGLRSIVIEPGHFRTSIIRNGKGGGDEHIDDYSVVLAPTQKAYEEFDGKQPGDTKKGATAFVDIVRGEGVAAGKGLPPVLPLGSDAVEYTKHECEEMLRRIEEWKEVCLSTEVETA
ncbi:NAD-P-binding protein [Amylostereum chailletii]|nr:NAD-P-binding protein [Amylostereum chailletii]